MGLMVEPWTGMSAQRLGGVAARAGAAPALSRAAATAHGPRHCGADLSTAATSTMFDPDECMSACNS